MNSYDKQKNRGKESKPKTNVQNTFKNSAVSNDGRPSSYDNVVDTDLESNAYIISEKFNEQFKNNVSNLKVNVDSYENLLTNYRNVADFYETIVKENSLLKKDIMITSGGILTNNRKSYYENQIVENLHYWYGWIRFFYILMIAGFIVGICLLPYEEPRFKYVAVLVLLAIYPFIINPIINWLRGIYQWIAGNYFSKD